MKTELEPFDERHENEESQNLFTDEEEILEEVEEIFLSWNERKVNNFPIFK